MQPHCSCLQVLYYLYSFSYPTDKNRFKGENELSGVEHTDTSFPVLQEQNFDLKREWEAGKNGQGHKTLPAEEQ